MQVLSPDRPELCPCSFRPGFEIIPLYSKVHIVVLINCPIKKTTAFYLFFTVLFYERGRNRRVGARTLTIAQIVLENSGSHTLKSKSSPLCHVSCCLKPVFLIVSMWHTHFEWRQCSSQCFQLFAQELARKSTPAPTPCLAPLTAHVPME